jgi:hypothetical protein
VETQAKRFFVSGMVQGVGFRFFAERTAASLGVGGYVKNLFDGRVEVYAIGWLLWSASTNKTRMFFLNLQMVLRSSATHEIEGQRGMQAARSTLK